MQRLSALIPMATMILSKRGKALRITLSCPKVMGSNEPGKTAILRFSIFLAVQPRRSGSKFYLPVSPLGVYRNRGLKREDRDKT